MAPDPTLRSTTTADRAPGDADTRVTRLLILDDELSYREYLGRYLAKLGHTVATAATADEALQLAERMRPELLLVDWMLSERQSGLAVALQIRARVPTARIVVMTGFPSEEVRAETQRAGVSHILTKPFGLDEAARAIEAVLASGASEAEPS